MGIGISLIGRHPLSFRGHHHIYTLEKSFKVLHLNSAGIRAGQDPEAHSTPYITISQYFRHSVTLLAPVTAIFL